MKQEQVEYPSPTDLEGCFNTLDLIMSNSDPKEFKWFKETKESDCLAQVHHGLGRYLRNSWGLWKKESPLYIYFNNMGLWHADDMSSVIITSYHRHLSGKKLNLKKQIDKHLSYWKQYQKENGPISLGNDE